MTSRSEVRNWLFKGLAVEQRLTSFEEQGIAVRAASDPDALQRVLPLEDFSGPIRSSAMRALPAYLAFFCLENAIRELVGDRLSENHGSDWWTTHTSNELREKVQRRQEKEGRDRWHTRRGEHEVYYTDFGDLKNVIRTNWADFADLFPDQNWVISRLDELEASRNIIAHSNSLDERELQRLRLYLQDWMRQVG